MHVDALNLGQVSWPIVIEGEMQRQLLPAALGVPQMKIDAR
jgi:hypothetical protein